MNKNDARTLVDELMSETMAVLDNSDLHKEHLAKRRTLEGELIAALTADDKPAPKVLSKEDFVGLVKYLSDLANDMGYGAHELIASHERLRELLRLRNGNCGPMTQQDWDELRSAIQEQG